MWLCAKRTGYSFKTLTVSYANVGNNIEKGNMGMFYNGANCDIYIGKGAGKKLLNDIRSASKSVKIISPYLSPFLITELIDLQNRNIEIELITSDNIEDFHGDREKNIHKLIKQNRVIDKVAIARRKKWKDLLKALTYIGYGLLTFLIGAAFIIRDWKVAIGILPIIVDFLLIKYYVRKINNTRIYSYWYSKLFPFKVYKSMDVDGQNATFLHSKIYLIDDQIAYLGSLNFTSSGIKHNYETRIRTEDREAVNEIKNEIHQLVNHSGLPERDIQYWGSQLYREPIN